MFSSQPGTFGICLGTGFCANVLILVTTLIKNLMQPLTGLIFIFYVYPGFRFASPWAIFWSPLPGLGLLFCKQLRNPKVSDLGLLRSKKFFFLPRFLLILHGF